MACDRQCVFDASHPTPHISIHVTMFRGRRMGKLYNKALSYNFQSTSLLRGIELVIRGQVITCIYLYNKGKFNALVNDEICSFYCTIE